MLTLIFGFIWGTLEYFKWIFILPGAIMNYQAGPHGRKFGLILGALFLILLGSELRDTFAPKTDEQVEAIQDANENRTGDMMQE